MTDRDSLRKEVKPNCPWCDKPMIDGEASVMIDGERFHLSCGAEEQDNAMFDRDMEFGARS